MKVVVLKMILSEKQSEDLEVLLALKVREFRKENIKSIDKSQIRDYLFSIKWKAKKRLETCDLVDDVFAISSAQIFEYMSRKAIQDAATLKIDDFLDLIAK